MSRRKITEEAESTDQEAEASTDSDERKQLTQRMPEDLVEEVDELMEELGLSSRNAAINMLVRRGLDEF